MNIAAMLAAASANQPKKRHRSSNWEPSERQNSAIDLRRSILRDKRNKRYVEVFEKHGPILTSKQVAGYLGYNSSSMGSTLKKMSEEPDPLVEFVGEIASESLNGRPQFTWKLTDSDN
jgi:hypothetical protein